MILVIILDSLLVGGIRFVLDKIATAVDQEMNDEGRLREELLAAQMRYELGEISDEEFTAFEDDVLARLREIREREREEAGGAGAMSFKPGAYDVDVSFTADQTYDEEEER
ncbi:MAG TPA: gas vesicle protein GvpG [Thermoanaerobaculia bacterium]|nr:gas vesicle protein GvpG [Thermoanaerobaculia bacterium]